LQVKKYSPREAANLSNSPDDQGPIYSGKLQAIKTPEYHRMRGLICKASGLLWKKKQREELTNAYNRLLSQYVETLEVLMNDERDIISSGHSCALPI
jgi:hypothetical protein